MATERYDFEKVTGERLEQIRRIAGSIEDKVEQLIEDVQELLEGRREDDFRRYGPSYGPEEENGYG